MGRGARERWGGRAVLMVSRIFVYRRLIKAHHSSHRAECAVTPIFSMRMVHNAICTIEVCDGETRIRWRVVCRIYTLFD